MMFGDEDDFDWDAPDVDVDDLDLDLLDEYETETLESEDDDYDPDDFDRRSDDDDDDDDDYDDDDDDDYDDDDDDDYDDDDDDDDDGYVDLDEFDWDAPEVDVEDLDLDLLDEYEMETQGLDDEVFKKYGIDRGDYKTRAEYIRAIEELRYDWEEYADEGEEYGVNAAEYKTRGEFYAAVKKAKYAWREEVEDGRKYGLSVKNYKTKEEYLADLEEEKYGWREYVDEGEEYGINPADYETEKEYNKALDAVRYAWRKEVESGKKYGLSVKDYETKEEYLEDLEEAKYGWREYVDEGEEYGINPADYETEAEYFKATEEAKYAWRQRVEDGREYDVLPKDYETEAEYLEELRQRKHGWRSSAKKDDGYGVNCKSYETEEEYLAALDRAKYAWREQAKDGALFELDAKDYETAAEYEEAFLEARALYGWREQAKDGLALGISVMDFETQKDYEQALESACQAPRKRGKKAIDAGKRAAPSRRADANLRGISSRKKESKQALEKEKAYGFCESAEDREIWRFVVNSNAIAADYISDYGDFLYAQAVKDYFALPFKVPNESRVPKTHFEELLEDLAQADVSLALDVWCWCLDTFSPYLRYAQNGDALTYGVLDELSSFGEAFLEETIERMERRPQLVKQVLFACTQAAPNVEHLIACALKKGYLTTAKRIYRQAKRNPREKVRETIERIESCIYCCMEDDRVELLELFRDEVFALVAEDGDVRIQKKLARWQKMIQQQIEKVEKQSEVYAFSRRYAWRAAYRDNDPDPRRYESEAAYLTARENQKYSWRWRVPAQKRAIVSPSKYETEEEYNAALREAEEKKKAGKKKDKKIYDYCRINPDGQETRGYYYFPGELSLQVGDRVVIPFGADDKEQNGTVIAIGKGLCSVFPCEIKRIKYVKSKL